MSPVNAEDQMHSEAHARTHQYKMHVQQGRRLAMCERQPDNRLASTRHHAVLRSYFKHALKNSFLGKLNAENR